MRSSSLSWLKNLKDTLKLLKHSKPKPVFCPKCNGSNISADSLYGVLPSMYNCRDCGYNGLVILEREETDELDSIHEDV